MAPPGPDAEVPAPGRTGTRLDDSDATSKYSQSTSGATQPIGHRQTRRSPHYSAGALIDIIEIWGFSPPNCRRRPPGPFGTTNCRNGPKSGASDLGKRGVRGTMLAAAGRSMPVASDWAEYDRLLALFDASAGPEPEGPLAVEPRPTFCPSGTPRVAEYIAMKQLVAVGVRTRSTWDLLEHGDNSIDQRIADHEVVFAAMYGEDPGEERKQQWAGEIRSKLAENDTPWIRDVAPLYGIDLPPMADEAADRRAEDRARAIARARRRPPLDPEVLARFVAGELAVAWLAGDPRICANVSTSTKRSAQQSHDDDDDGDDSDDDADVEASTSQSDNDIAALLRAGRFPQMQPAIAELLARIGKGATAFAGTSERTRRRHDQEAAEAARALARDDRRSEDSIAREVRARRSETGLRVKSCEWCGATFEAVRSNARFCAAHKKPDQRKGSKPTKVKRKYTKRAKSDPSDQGKPDEAGTMLAGSGRSMPPLDVVNTGDAL